MRMPWVHSFSSGDSYPPLRAQGPQGKGRTGVQGGGKSQNAAERTCTVYICTWPARSSAGHTSK